MQSGKNRSRRLRKKLYLDEFAMMGFEFSCKIDLKQEAEFDTLFDALAELIYSRNLLVDGGGNEDGFEGYIISGERYESATDEDRKAIEEWLKAQPGVSDVEVDDLSDAFYGM